MFRVRPFEAKTLSWWHAERDNIDFNPSYQRKGGLWSQKDKSYLIDSILNEFDIPKVYLADFTYVDTKLNEKKKSYSIIDGKQRFEAIFEFFDGKLVLDKEFEFDSDPNLKLGGLSYKDIKSQYPKVASKFDNYNLAVMSVITDGEGKINDLFVRLNRNKPLSGAEVRSAMQGEIPRLIKNISSHSFFKSNIKFTTLRKQDENAAAKLLLIEFRGKFVETKKVHLDRFVDEGLKSETTSFKNAEKRVIEILDDMAEVFINKDPLLKSSGALTIYYWLFKNFTKEYKGKIREFLVKFEQDRKHSSEQELFTYGIAIRSPNDPGSMTRAYNILSKYFNNFLNIRQ